MEIPSRLERGAAQFNRGEAVITADERCVERARDLEKESIDEVMQAGPPVRGCDRGLWPKWARAGLEHEGAHTIHDTGPTIGPRDEVSQFELSELFAQLSEWSGIFDWAATQQVSATRRAGYLRDQVTYMVDDDREGIRGILTKLRCINPCADVAKAVADTFNKVAGGWPSEQRNVLLRELADPSRRLGWPIPAPPALRAPGPDPKDRPKFGPLYQPRRTFVPELERSLEEL
jgi:hypothetical protein